MKTKATMPAMLSLSCLVLEGCVSFPPLVQVEHKDSASNQEVIKRLDSIDHRLDKLEEKTAQK